MVGLSEITTQRFNKPVSTTQTALDLKANLASQLYRNRFRN
jgi:hypothetical protein